MVDVFKGMVDVFKGMVDVFKRMVDVFKGMVDVFKGMFLSEQYWEEIIIKSVELYKNEVVFKEKLL